MAIESFEDLRNTFQTLHPPETVTEPSEQLILELFKLLSKELQEKNALIKDLIRALSANNKKYLPPAEEGSNFSDIVQLATPILNALAQKKATESDESKS